MIKRKLKRRLFLLLSVGLAMFQVAVAQVKQPTSKRPKAKVELIARSFGDSIMLRWAPNSPALWNYGNNYGYIIERYTIGYNDSPVENPEKLMLVDNPVKPQTLDQIEPVAMQDNYAAIVAQAIYGESFDVNSNVNNDVTSFFNTAKDFENRFSFSLFAADQSIRAAKAHGLVFTDKQINPNERYLYRVYLSVPITVFTADTGFTYVNPQETFDVPPPMDVEAKFGDGLVELSWNREFFERIFTSYYVERSDDNGKLFRKISDLPFINTTKSRGYSPERTYITDSLPGNDKRFIYRVRGVTPFGEISPPSDTVSGMGRSTTPYINPIIIKNDIINEEHITIHWEVLEENAKYIKGFNVYKADNSDGPFAIMNESKLSASARQFTDTVPFGTNYYQVAALDKYGRASVSFPSLAQLPDTIPPAPPVNLRGNIDTSGIVTIEWDPNTERDLMGYNLLVANNPEAEFMIVNKELIKQNKYQDTTIVKTITRNIYYKVSALDKRYNQSAHSEVLVLERPDRVPPATAQFTGWDVTESGISLKWQKSFSDDVEKYLIYRNADKDLWKLIGIVDSLGDYNHFTDREVEVGNEYSYILVAVDKSGLESKPSKELQVKATNNKPEPAITEFYGQADYANKSIKLAWNYSRSSVQRYLIYRSAGEGMLKIYRSVEGNVLEFTDKGITKGRTYIYRIQAVLQNGQKSALSDNLEISY